MANGMQTTTGAATIDPLLQSFLEAQKQRIRRGAALLQRQATGAAASKGLQTSGVSEIPAAPIRKQRLASEAEAAGQVAMRQFGEQKLDERLREQFQRSIALMKLRAKLLKDIEKERSKAGLLSGGIGGGLGLVSGLITGGKS